MPDEPAKRMAKRRWPSFLTWPPSFLSYKRNYLEIFMLPTLSPHPPPWAWVIFPAVFQLPRLSECQQPDPRSSMRHFRTFPSPGITAEDPPREQNALSHSRDIFGIPSREQNALFCSRDNLGRPFREQNKPSCSRDNLGRPYREQNAPSCSRDSLGRLFREQNPPFRSRDILGATVRYGDSTGAPQCRRGETRASATHRETWCLSGR